MIAVFHLCSVILSISSIAPVYMYYRINLFYDVAYCISLECSDCEEDIMEIVTRFQALAPNLTPSHEVHVYGMLLFSSYKYVFGHNMNFVYCSDNLIHVAYYKYMHTH